MRDGTSRAGQMDQIRPNPADPRTNGPNGLDLYGLTGQLD